MKVNRRDFIAGVSLSALFAGSSEARPLRGGSANLLNAGKAWQNSFLQSDLPLANLVKNISAQAGGGGLDYPSYTQPSGLPKNQASFPGISNNLPLDQTYYGHYGLEFTGQGSWQLATQFIVYNGGAFVNGLSGNTGSGAFNMAIVGQSNPFVEFAYGFLAVAVGTNGGLVQFSAFPGGNCFANVSTGSTYKFNNLTGLPAGPNTDGSWTITHIDNDTITLQGSSAYAGLVSITNSGGPGVQTEGILSVASDTWTLLSSGPYSNMANLLWYKMANQVIVRADSNARNPDYIAKMVALRPYGNRFMDAMLINQNNFTDFSQRAPLNSFCFFAGRWNNDPVTGYWAGQSSGTNTYTCTNPPGSPSSGAYQQNETVQLQFVNGNTGYSPTLQLGSRAAAPLFDVGTPVQKLFRITGTVLSTDSFSIQFSASYLSGGLQTVTVTGQTSGTAVAIALVAGIQANANLLANNVNSGFQGGGINLGEIQYSLAAGSLTITPSTTSAGATFNFGTMAPGIISASQLSTCVYDTALGGFMVYNGSLTAGVPIEIAAATCNQLGCHMWVNIPHLFNATNAQAMGATARSVLHSNLKCYPEPSNEVWNNIFNQTAYAGMKGVSWGIPVGSDRAVYAFYAYLAATTLPAFQTGFGSANLVKVMALQQYLGTDLPTNETYRFEGADLVPSSLYPGPNFSTVGNRPCDIALDTVAWANYTSGAQLTNFDGNYQNLLTFGGPSTYTSGDLPTYDGLLGAADAYNNNVGNGRSNALDFIDWDLRGGLQVIPSQTLTASNSSGTLLLSGPTLQNGTKVIFGFNSGGSVPNALTAGKTYFVVGTSGATFRISLTLGGAAIAYGSTNGSNLIYGLLGTQTIEYQNTVQNPLVSQIPTKYGKTTDFYEGAEEANGPSTAECTSLGISTAYSAKIGTLFTAYKNDARFKQFVVDMVAGLQTLSPPARENWYELSAGSQWSLGSGDINAPFYKSFDGLVQVNN